MTSNDLERQNRGFYGFLAISGCDTSLYYSQNGATEVSKASIACRRPGRLSKVKSSFSFSCDGAVLFGTAGAVTAATDVDVSPLLTRLHVFIDRVVAVAVAYSSNVRCSNTNRWLQSNARECEWSGHASESDKRQFTGCKRIRLHVHTIHAKMMSIGI